MDKTQKQQIIEDSHYTDDERKIKLKETRRNLKWNVNQLNKRLEITNNKTNEM